MAENRPSQSDNVRTGTAKAVARLMSFAQITCYTRYLHLNDLMNG